MARARKKRTNNIPPRDAWLTYEEAGEALGVEANTVAKYATRGLVRSRRRKLTLATWKVNGRLRITTAEAIENFQSAMNE
jgi:hypothetical protein